MSPGSGTPSGTVTFEDSSTVLGTVPLTKGTASFATSSLAVGTHSIKAVYAGDTNFKTSTSAVLKHVVTSSSNVVVAVTIAPSLVDQALSALRDESADRRAGVRPGRCATAGDSGKGRAGGRTRVRARPEELRCAETNSWAARCW